MKTKWLKALRSGKYKQGQSILCQTDYDSKCNEHLAYCCLGVLNEVCDLGSNPDYSYLTEQAQEKVGLTKTIQVELSYMNDGIASKYNPRSRKMKFTTIANWIEKNL